MTEVDIRRFVFLVALDGGEHGRQVGKLDRLLEFVLSSFLAYLPRVGCPERGKSGR